MDNEELTSPRFSKDIHGDALKTMEQLTNEQGLSFEEHTITTEDGYILTMFHIWKQSGGIPVFFQDGLFSSAETWAINEHRSPAFRAAQAGYDVWLGNNRGNKYSRDHLILDPDNDHDKPEFFNYSFYELGKYDAPAQIDYVLQQTNKKQI